MEIGFLPRHLLLLGNWKRAGHDCQGGGLQTAQPDNSRGTALRRFVRSNGYMYVDASRSRVHELWLTDIAWMGGGGIGVRGCKFCVCVQRFCANTRRRMCCLVAGLEGRENLGFESTQWRCGEFANRPCMVADGFWGGRYVRGADPYTPRTWELVEREMQKGVFARLCAPSRSEMRDISEPSICRRSRLYY